MPRFQSEELLILTKTYPYPSTKYRETTCVAALNRSGQMRRLYPVPYRFLDGNQQFQKWEWIRASLSKPREDNRPESFHVDTDSIVRTNLRIGTEHAWRERRQWIQPHCVAGFQEIETRRQTSGQTLGFIRPTKIIQLMIKPVKEKDWTQEEKLKLVREGLFDSQASRTRPILKKIPFKFSYEYETNGRDGIERQHHMLTDWEVGALYWRCYRDYGTKWETYFRKKLEDEFSRKDVYFLMGTVHRFPDQWLIVGLFYPSPVKTELPSTPRQLELGFPHEGGPHEVRPQ